MKNSQLAIIQSIRAQLDVLEKTLLAEQKPQRLALYEKLPCLWSEIESCYDLSSSVARWMTCAQICEENGIEPNQSNCSRLGQSIPKRIPRRRSNGKTLLLMPPLLEKF